ncbi:hypothetical protein N431DRAFT_413060 [Stipitochalara longipes BDJ]|nr:hypothetical protein N431DRAFT_413060 [Stipitochalara longipes BDJ]
MRLELSVQMLRRTYERWHAALTPVRPSLLDVALHSCGPHKRDIRLPLGDIQTLSNCPLGKPFRFLLPVVLQLFLLSARHQIINLPP